MTTEEKAKAYDEALAAIKGKYEMAKKEKAWGTVKWMEEVFPVLAESEDERIRESIVSIIKQYARVCEKEGDPCEASLIDDALAYLEEQKDASKAIEAVERIDKYIDAHTANAHDMDDSNPDKKYYQGQDDALGKIAGILQYVYSDEKQKEQKPDIELIQRSWYMEGYNDRKFGKEPKWIIKAGEGGPKYEENPKYGQMLKEQKPVETQDYSGLTDLERAIHRGFLCAGVENVPITIIKETSQDCLAQMKPAEWSEEDKNMWARLNEYLYGFQCSKNAIKQMSDWFYELPNRFNLQSKQEWSEEDETAFSDLMWCIEQARKSAKDENDMGNIWFAENWLKKKLKSLRPQPKSIISDTDKSNLRDAPAIIRKSNHPFKENIALIIEKYL